MLPERQKRKFEVRPPSPEYNKVVAAFCGRSGSGKTYSSLIFASGFLGGLENPDNMIPDKPRIIIVDTELRANDYLPEIGKSIIPYHIMPFDPPYSPESYMDAYEQAEEIIAERGGFIIFDSLSHGWDDEGGILDLAEKLAPQTKSGGVNLFAGYKKPKMDLHKFMNRISKSKTNIICCFRTRQSAVVDKYGKPTGEHIEKVIADKQYEYYFTMRAMFSALNQHVSFVKCSKPYRHCTTVNSVLTAQTAANFARAMAGEEVMLVISNEWKKEIYEAQTQEELKQILMTYKTHAHIHEHIVPALSAKKSEIIQKQYELEELSKTETANALLAV